MMVAFRRGLLAILGRPGPPRAMVLAAATALLGTAMNVIIRHVADDLHPFVVAFFRVLFGFLVLAPLLVRYGAAPLRTRRLGLLALRGIINAVGTLLFIAGLVLAPLAKVAALMFSSPLFTAIMALVLLREGIRLRRVMALIVGFAGTLVIVRPGLIEIDFGALLTLGSAATIAVTMILAKDRDRRAWKPQSFVPGAGPQGSRRDRHPAGGVHALDLGVRLRIPRVRRNPRPLDLGGRDHDLSFRELHRLSRKADQTITLEPALVDRDARSPGPIPDGRREPSAARPAPKIAPGARPALAGPSISGTPSGHERSRETRGGCEPMSGAETKSPGSTIENGGRDFVRDIVRADLAAGRTTAVVTRFPPEPNGYLHIGHAKSICLNFGVAAEFGGRCHLRFDDTNPVKEEQAFIAAIEADVRWLGFEWGEHLYCASDNFEHLYEWAEHLIRAGKAYVDDLSADEIRAHRGTLTEAGRNSPYRDRPVPENLDLFQRMRAGEFADGARVLRAKIDMASGNINLRDPVMYRIVHADHPRTGSAWCIYPTYDYAHGQSDAIEGVTHSLCTLEFEDHRPLYDWFIENLPAPSRPRQYEFARLNLSYTMLSKRRLTELVRGGHVTGWDDPRMPTLAGLRRRGFPAAAIRDFAGRIGVAKANSTVDVALLEHCARELLNRTAERRMAVLRPLKVVIENYPEDQTETLDAVNNPEDPGAGTRSVPIARVVYIERDDFMEDPPKKFFRLAPGREVRLRYAYLVTCREALKDAAGEVVELRCTYDPESRGGTAPDGRKVKATLHWVLAAHAIEAEVRLYDHLFTRPDPGAGGDFRDDLNPDSLTVLAGCKLEPALAEIPPATVVQFERQGYFCLDPEATLERPVFNRTVALRDTWAKVKAKEGV